MTISSPLLYAILSMDAYNRGADPHLAVSSSSLGDISFLTDSLNQLNAASTISAGFYAAAYRQGSITIISYRGTDPQPSVFPDILNGWVTGAGLLHSQSDFAEQFYASVTGKTIFDGPDPNVVLTGHSLGGGLAGFVGSITGDSSYVFDNMPYAAAAISAVLNEDAKRGFNGFGNVVTGGPHETLVPLPGGSSVKSYHVANEILTYVRSLPPNLLALGSLWGPAAEAAAEAIPLQETSNTLDSHAGFVDPFNFRLHSIPLLVLLQYASDNGLTSWQAAGTQLYAALFNDKIGTALGLNTLATGVASAADKLDAMIAYSAIDAGSMPYGNTGIAALFHDFDILGSVLSLSEANGNLAYSSNPDDIADIIIQYAGELALNAKLASDDLAPGVLTLSDRTLAVSLDESTWRAAGEFSPPAVGQGELVLSALTNADPTEDLFQRIKLYYGLDGISAVNRVIFATSNQGLSLIPDAPTSSIDKADVFIGGLGADTVVGSNGNDIILAGPGNDTIDVSAGRDIIYGRDRTGIQIAETNTVSFFGVDSPIGFSINGLFIDYRSGDDGYSGCITGVNNIILRSADDILDVAKLLQNITRSYGDLTIDGAGGLNTALVSGCVVDGERPDYVTEIWSFDGQNHVELKSFSNFYGGNLTYLAGVAAQSNVAGPAILISTYDLSNATTSAFIDVGSFAGFSDTVAIGDAEMPVGIGPEIVGTNFGDTWHVGVSYHAKMTIDTGFGNDVVNNEFSAGDHNPGDTGPFVFGVQFLTIVYRGGNDVIENAADVDTLRIWNGLSLSDISGIQYAWNPDGFSHAKVFFRQGGSLTLNNLVVDGTNNEDPMPNVVRPQGYLDRLTFDSGGYIQFVKGGEVKVIGGADANYAVFGSWGDDVLFGKSGGLIYGLGGNDLITAKGTTIYGGAGNDTLISGSGLNLLMGGEDDDIYDLNDASYAELSDSEGRNSINTDVPSGGYSSQVVDGSLYLYDDSGHLFGKVDDPNSFGVVNFGDGMSANVADVAAGDPILTPTVPAGPGGDTLTAWLLIDGGASNTDGVTFDPGITGTTTPLAEVVFSEAIPGVGSVELGAVTADASGFYTFEPPSEAEGPHSITAAVGSSIATVSFVLDTVHPSVSCGLIHDTGASSTDDISADGRLTGSGDADTSVALSIDNNPIAFMIKSDALGLFSYVPSGLADGVHTVVSSQSDLAGNYGEATLSFTLDTTPPLVTASAGESTIVAQSAAGAAEVFAASAKDAIDGFADPIAFTEQLSGGATRIVRSGDVFAPGTHTIVATATDAAGNIGSSSPVTFWVVDKITKVALLPNGTTQTSTYINRVLSQTVITGITGQAYTGYTVSYGTNGRPVSASYSDGETATWAYAADGTYRVSYSGIVGQRYTTHTIDCGTTGRPVSGLFGNGITQTWTYAADGSYTLAYAGITGQAYTGYTVSYGTNGRPVSASYSDGETAAWAYAADGTYRVSYSGIVGQKYTTHTIDYGTTGRPVSGLFGNGMTQTWTYAADGSYTLACQGIQRQPYASYEVLCDTRGKPTAQKFIEADNSLYLSDTISVDTDSGRSLYTYGDGSYLLSRSLDSFERLVGADGVLLEQKVSSKDGSHRYFVPGNDLVIDASHDDVISATGHDIEVKFGSVGFGTARFSGYQAGDVFVFARSVFAGYQDLLSHASGTTSAVLTDAGHDTLTMVGVARSSLGEGMFRFV